MANPRLTNSIRRQIKNHLLEDRFGDEQERIKGMVAKIGPMAYEIAFPKKIRDLVNQLPPEWIRTQDDILVAVDGEREYYSFGPKDPSNPEDGQVELPYPVKERYSVLDALSFNSRETYRGKARQLMELVVDSRNAQAALKKERREAELKIDAVLESATTRKKLIEIWPEIEPTLDRIWPNNEPVKVTKELAVNMSSLNESLGLPESKK